MAPGISFGHFNIVGGNVREDGPYVGVVEDRSPAESLADLYVVIEPAEPGSEALCPELLHLIVGQFGRPQYSLTGNLLQSLRAAQEHLRSWNRTAPADRHASAGASCLAVSGNTAYLAQTGPCVVYLRHDGHLRIFEPIEPESQAPLGTTIACSPCFNRFELNQGDTLLLVTSRFRTMVDDETADLILSLPAGEALPEIYKAARAQTEFSALYLAVTGELHPAIADDTEVAPRQAGARVRSATQREGPPGRSRFRAEHAGQLLPDGPYARAMAEVIHQERAADQARRARQRQLQRLTERHSFTVPRPALYTVAAVLALTLAGWLGLPRLLQTGRDDRFTTLLRDAQQKDQASNSSQDPAQKRSLLEKAQADLVDAATIRPQAPALVNLQTQTLRALQTLDQVRALPPVTTVADLSTMPIAARSVTELAATSRIYVLDNSSGQVYALGGNAQEKPSMAVFQPGALVEGIETGKAVHIAVQPGEVGQPPLLYVLDGNHRLFSLDEGGTLRAEGLAGTSDWKSATSIAFGGKDLYILDSAANQVWHYTPRDAGFTSPPTATLEKANLRDAAQLSVANGIYVSTVNGHLLHFPDGKQEEVNLSGIDYPLRSPQPPLLDGAAGIQYIGDPGNQRIVAAGTDDVYRFQYSGALLGGLRAIALDPSTGLLYALSEQKIIAVPLH